jgi:hypothetical protein
MGSDQTLAMGRNNWYHSSSHGAVLSCVAADPHCTVNDLSESLFLAQRTVWGIIGDLRRAGMVHVRKNGRRHHYTVNLDAPFEHQASKDYTRRPVLGELIGEGRSAGD